MDIAVNSIVAGLMVGTIYGLVAVGFVIIYKCSGVLNLSQGALALFGGYVSWSFMYELGLPPGWGCSWPWWWQLLWGCWWSASSCALCWVSR
ncbi:MAG: hypothetical protein V1849_02960 [Chloroflexota bacterium]